jgi:hypothetical protein
VVEDFLEIRKGGEDWFVTVGSDSGIRIADDYVGVLSLSGIFVELEVDIGG